ncbi:MAG TPA: glutamate racemase [Caldithrix sp.]|nr:glutamate racemase [Caldithrix sp.]
MKKPIGIFDSGIGGLTVVEQLMHLLPNEQLIYFGDTARIPYGTKSKRLIERYAVEDAKFLLQYDIKALVVACNTASSLAMDVLLNSLDVPVIGVVIPGAEAAVKLTCNNKIGVIGTIATINSKSYTLQIQKRLSEAQVFGQACPLLVPLVEEGWLDDEVTILTLKKYLPEMIKEQVDTLILGCTHYPLLEKTIQKIMGDHVRLIDSGKETAKAVKQVLIENNLINRSDKPGPDKFFVSDIPMKFEEIGSRFLGKTLDNVERVDFERFLVKLEPGRMNNLRSNIEV